MLDTCILLNAWRMTEDLLGEIRRPYRWATATTMFEFLRREDRDLLPETEVAKRVAWLDENAVRTIGWTPEASSWLGLLARSRSPVSVGDAHIAAACVGRGFPLLTRNLRDFEALPELRLVDPPK